MIKNAPSSVIFVDSNIADYQSLVNSVEPETKVVVLDTNRNGVEQITEVLANYDNLDSVQILSHGDSAVLQLGNSSLDNSNIESYENQLQQWGKALSENGDLLLYGCIVAAGKQGKAFINRLGEITAADAEEAQRAAELQAEAERKAAKEAQRAAELQVEKERKVAEEAKRAAQLRAEEERKVAEEAKCSAELLEKLDGNPNKDEIFIKIRKIVSEELEMDEEAINLDSNIEQDLDAESMEILKIIMAVEEEFDIEIPDEDAENLMRVGDIVNYLHDSLKLKAEQKAAEEAQRAAELRAEAERKAAEEAKRAVELQAEAERRAAAAAKRVAELREKFDGNPNKEEIFLRLRKVISEQVEISEEYVQLNSHIVHNLGVDELEIISLAMAVEEEFDIEIPSELLDSVEKWPPSHTWSGCFRDRVPVGCTVEELLDYIYQNINDNSETE